MPGRVAARERVSREPTRIRVAGPYSGERKSRGPKSPGSPPSARPTPQSREAPGRSCPGGSGAVGRGKRAGCAQTRGALAGRTGPTVAGGKIRGDRDRVAVKFPPRRTTRKSSEMSLRSVWEIEGEPVRKNEGEKEKKLLSRFGGANRWEVVVIQKGYKFRDQRAPASFGNGLLGSKV